MGVFQNAPWTRRKPPTSRLTFVVAITPPPPPPFAPLPTPTAAPSPVDVPQHGGWCHQRADRGSSDEQCDTADHAWESGGKSLAPDRSATLEALLLAAGQTACVNGGVLQPGASCSIGFEFVPTAAGATHCHLGGSPLSATCRHVTVTLQGTATGAGGSTAPTSSANAPLNAGAGALGWINLLGLLVLLGLAGARRR